LFQTVSGRMRREHRQTQLKDVNIENEWLTADGDHGRLRCRALTVPFVPEGRGSSSTVLGGGSTLVR
jgi:hypothetical protein